MMELIILKNLVHNDEYARVVLPHLRHEYFKETSQRTVFDCISVHFEKYSALPQQSELVVRISERKDLSENTVDAVGELLSDMYGEVPTEGFKWLFDETEKFCKKQALDNATYAAIDIIEGNDTEHTWEAIPDLYNKALQVGFDIQVGHDYLGDYAKRFHSYHSLTEKVPFDITLLNEVTGGGSDKGTVNIVFAPPGGGKSAFLCHHAATCLSNHLNVVYFSMEMSEMKVSRRVDANLLNVNLSDLKRMPEDVYMKRMASLADGAPGRLFVKQFPTSSASVTDFRATLQELQSKKNFAPDIIFVDYLNICASARFKAGNKGGSYEFVKAIVEEIRALGIVYNVPTWSAAQFNRGGASSSDASLTDAADSYGLAYTADFAFSIYRTEDMIRDNEALFKQLKNRDEDGFSRNKFMVGMDLRKMKFFDCENQEGLLGPDHMVGGTGGVVDHAAKTTGWVL